MMLKGMVNVNLMLNLGRKVEMKMDMPRGMAMDLMNRLENAAHTGENIPITVMNESVGKAMLIKPKMVLFGYIDVDHTVEIIDVSKKKCSCDHKAENTPVEKHIAKPQSIGEVIEEKMKSINVSKEDKKDPKEEPKRMSFEKGTPEWYENTHRVMIDCKECGKISFARLYKDSKQANCKLCGATVDVSELIRAKAQCKCGHNYNINVPVNCREVQCMNCHAPIDLKLHEKKNILVSMK